jgi:hypothetical protein
MFGIIPGARAAVKTLKRRVAHAAVSRKYRVFQVLKFRKFREFQIRDFADSG